MRIKVLFVLSMLVIAAQVCAGEEKIRGLLEKTTKPDASAQITDALNDIYFLEKSDTTEKLVANFVGKGQKVVVTGSVETKPNDTHFYVSVKNVEPFMPKLPPAPPPPPPAVVEKKDEGKKDEPKVDVKKDEPKVDVKKEEVKVDVKKDEPKVDVKKDEPKVEVKKEETKVETKKDEAK